MQIPAKAPAVVVVFEAEEPVRMYEFGDSDRAREWVSADRARAAAMLSAIEAADASDPLLREDDDR